MMTAENGIDGWSEDGRGEGDPSLEEIWSQAAKFSAAREPPERFKPPKYVPRQFDLNIPHPRQHGYRRSDG